MGFLEHTKYFLVIYTHRICLKVVLKSSLSNKNFCSMLQHKLTIWRQPIVHNSSKEPITHQTYLTAYSHPCDGGMWVSPVTCKQTVSEFVPSTSLCGGQCRLWLKFSYQTKNRLLTNELPRLEFIFDVCIWISVLSFISLLVTGRVSYHITSSIITVYIKLLSHSSQLRHQYSQAIHMLKNILGTSTPVNV